MATKVNDGKALFEYDGSFFHFGVVQGRGKFHTYAVSFKQARNNILYQYKKEYGYKPTFKLDLDMTKLHAVEE